MNDILKVIKRLESIKDPIIPMSEIRTSGIVYGDLSLSQFKVVEYCKDKALDAETNIELVDKALEATGLTLQEFATQALLSEAKRIVKSEKYRPELESMTDEELKVSKRRGSALVRINRAFQKVLKHNESKPGRKIFISKSILFKLTGCNMKSVRTFYKKNQEAIDRHHEQYEITELDNLRGENVKLTDLLK